MSTSILTGTSARTFFEQLKQSYSSYPFGTTNDRYVGYFKEGQNEFIAFDNSTLDLFTDCFDRRQDALDWCLGRELDD